MKLVKDDSVSKFFLDQCPQVPVKLASIGKAKNIVAVSDILKNAGPSMLD
jgi:hypothetical protein